MRKIAMITPWPDQKTGIADYAFDLTHGLVEAGANVDVFTSNGNARKLEGVTIRSLHCYEGAASYDRTIYQMGNCSDFHIEMLPILAENPGVVHLHDTILHHLVAFVLFREDVEAYYRVLQCWYSDDQVEAVRRHNETEQECFWDGPEVMQIPFFEPVLQYATKCIVHSEFAKNLVHARLPSLPIARIAQLYRGLKPIAKEKNKEFRIGIFGVVQKHKHVDLVFKVLSELVSEFGGQFHLAVCGALDRGCEDLGDLVKQLKLEEHVTLRGRVTETEFAEEMQRSDLCISLRAPTMGETSAVVTRAMQIGLPCIVNDIGWYGELPSCVHKLPISEEGMRERLLVELQSCLRSSEYFAAWRSETIQVASKEFDYGATVREYLERASEDEERLWR